MYISLSQGRPGLETFHFDLGGIVERVARKYSPNALLKHVAHFQEYDFDFQLKVLQTNPVEREKARKFKSFFVPGSLGVVETTRTESHSCALSSGRMTFHDLDLFYVGKEGFKFDLSLDGARLSVSPRLMPQFGLYVHESGPLIPTSLTGGRIRRIDEGIVNLNYSGFNGSYDLEDQKLYDREIQGTVPIISFPKRSTPKLSRSLALLRKELKKKKRVAA